MNKFFSSLDIKYIGLICVIAILVAKFFGWNLIGTSRNWHMFFLICVSSASWRILQEKIAEHYRKGSEFTEDANFDSFATTRNSENRDFVYNSFLSVFFATILSFVFVLGIEIFLQAWYTHAEKQNIPDTDISGFISIVFFTLILAFFIGPVKFIKKQTFLETDDITGRPNKFGLKAGRAFVLDNFSILRSI